MIRQWKKYEKGPPRATKDVALVSLSKKGVLCLNRMAYEKLGKPPAVTILMDTVNSCIGLKPAMLETPGAFPLIPKGEYGHHLIRIIQFCRDMRIHITYTIRFPRVTTDDNVMVLDLRSAVRIGKGSLKVLSDLEV